MIERAPIYSESPRSTFISNLLFYIGVGMTVVAVPFGVFSGVNDGNWGNAIIDAVAMLLVGSLLAGTHWLIVPRRYDVRESSLDIVYGNPRRRVFDYDTVSEIEVKTYSVATEIRVHTTYGRVVSLHPLNPKEFHVKLETAILRYRKGASPPTFAD